jgi:hypothetical protein
MRQGQQNRRGRGRHHNNGHGHGHGQHQQQHHRKGQNPLTRSYESNGPEVKIRGNPAHIAEKYISLARDAQSSGDPVLAENYLQHAEHYNRIILAYREQQMQQGGQDQSAPRFRQPGEGEDAEANEDGGEGGSSGAEIQVRGQEPQPGVYDAAPAPQQAQGFGGQGGERQGGQHQRPRYDDRGPRRHGGDGGRDRDFGGGREQGRHYDQGRHRDRDYRRFDGDRPERAELPDRPEQMDRRPRNDRPERPPQAEPIQADAPQNGEGGASGRRLRERIAGAPPAHEQPEFLRRPVRRPRREAGSSEGTPSGSEGDDRE